MRKVLVIAARDYKAAVRTKFFLISLVFMPVLMGGSVLVQFLFSDQVDTREKRFAIVDRTPGQRLFPALDQAVKERNEKHIPAFRLEQIDRPIHDSEDLHQLRFELSERVRKKELFGFLEIGADIVSSPPAAVGEGGTPSPRPSASRTVRYQSDSPTYNDFHHWAKQVINEAVKRERARKAGLSPETVQAVVQEVPLVTLELAKRDTRTGTIVEGKEANFLTAFFVPLGLMMLMFMLVIGGSSVTQAVVEEKMGRIAEVLLGSVTPFQLMLGKLLGTVAVSLTLAVVYLAGTYWAARRYEFADAIPLELLAWFIAFQVLSVLMYNSLFIAIGAACTNAHETQSLLMPVTLLACLPLFVLTNVLREPNSTLSTGFSFFPPATPMMMIARLAVPPGLPLWQPVLGMVAVLATVLVFVYGASRIFRVGILVQGKGAKLGDMVKWVFRG